MLACLLANKRFALGEVSMHLMNKRYLNKFEHSSSTDALEFPYSYPTQTHSSTIFLMKGFVREESIFVDFNVNGKFLEFVAKIGNIESILTLNQMHALVKFSQVI